MDKRIYVVPGSQEDLRHLVSFDDIPLNDDRVYVCWVPLFFEGLRYFEGDRLVIGNVEYKDERLRLIQNSLSLSGHWIHIGAFTDVTIGKPKISK